MKSIWNKGKATFSAVVPIEVTSSAIRPGSGPITAALIADDVELSNFNSLLPKGAQIGGRIDGRLAGGGTVSVPQLSGSLRLSAGSFRAPEQKSPLTGIGADLTFSGNHAHLQSSTALGGGTLSLAGTASFASLRRPAETTANLVVSAQNARLDLSPYFRGNVNGNVTLARSPVTGAVAGGDVTLSQSRISIGAFLGDKSGGNESSFLPALSFSGLKVIADRDVRVQDANVDVGATGSVTVDGTLAAPKLTGTFDLERRHVELLPNVHHRAGAGRVLTRQRIHSRRQRKGDDVRHQPRYRHRPAGYRSGDEHAVGVDVATGVQPPANPRIAGRCPTVRRGARRAVNGRRYVFSLVGGCERCAGSARHALYA